MVQVILFVGDEVRDKMMREVVPRIGETIVIDCGEMVKVIEVNHQWDDPDFVQLKCEEVKQ